MTYCLYIQRPDWSIIASYTSERVPIKGDLLILRPREREQEVYRISEVATVVEVNKDQRWAEDATVYVTVKPEVLEKVS